jgi:hypothetical protein
MPVYESETINRKALEEIRKRNSCATCGEYLSMFFDPDRHLAFIACHDWTRTHHDDGIGRFYEYRELNINSRREQMENQIGKEKTRALAKYQGVTSLTRQDAMEILETIWPEAPEIDKTAAAMLCANYGLNPLANHVFLIKFHNKRLDRDEWTRVWGIKAKRLLASRKSGYSYLDMSPRLMTDDEQIKVWGKVDQANLCFLTHLKDMRTGAEAYGYGKWPKNQEPYGTDKGNSKENMTSIRSESQALDRLRPAEMPGGWTVADEQYIEGESRVIDVTTEEITEHIPHSVNVLPSDEPEPLPDASESTENPAEDTSQGISQGEKERPSKTKEKTPELVGKIRREWLLESVNKLHMDVLKYCKDTFKVTISQKETLFDVVGKLSEENQISLVKEIEDRLGML